MKLVLFDVDGTLIQTGGAGLRAFSRTLIRFFGISKGLSGIRPDGKTDPLIIGEALRNNGFVENPPAALLERFFDDYVQFLKTELEAHRSEYKILPAVEKLLDYLVQDRSLILGLATGNVEEGAKAKLEFGGLDRFFKCGGFGSDSSDRTKLIERAVERARIIAGARPIKEVTVVGDTPNDICHGKKAGARTIAVATGSYTFEELERHSPDLVVSSLDPIETIIRFLGTGKAGL
jgi:phosphoglycolate phosphatase-like HAD superfamily hydrolase